MAEIVTLSLPMSGKTDPQLRFNTRSGGEAIDGSEQILSPLSERWTFAATFPIRNETQARIIRRAKSLLKGRFNYLMICLCDQFRLSRRDIGAPVVKGPVPHSDNTFFSDGSGYAVSQPSAPLTAAAARNDTQIQIRASDLGGAMSAGLLFSIDYWLYQVDEWEMVGSNYVLQISPPLREPVSADDVADFTGKSIWQLATDTEGELMLNTGRFGVVTLNLVEPVSR